MNEEKKSKKFLEMLDDTINKSEFISAFKNVLEQIALVERNLTKRIDDKTQSANSAFQELQNLYRETIKKIEKENQSSFSNMKKWAMEQVSTLFVKYQIKEKIAEIDRKMAEVRDGKDADEQKIVQDVLAKIPLFEKIIPETREQLKEKLELEIKDIRGLEEEIETLKKQKGKGVYLGPGSESGGHIVKLYDLSSQLNGVLKTFSLPAFWRVVGVQLSSLPYGAARPTTDYTTDASAFTITFTSAIDATTTLASGQSLLVQYAQA